MVYNLEYTNHKSWKIVQCKGTDYVEHTFSSLRNKNVNLTIMYCSSNLERRVSVRSSTFLFAQRRGTPEATCSAAMGISELIQQPFNKQKMYDVNDPQSTRSVTEI